VLFCSKERSILGRTMSEAESQESTTIVALIEQMTRMITQMTAMQTIVINNSQPTTQIIPQPIAMTEGSMVTSKQQPTFLQGAAAGSEPELRQQPGPNQSGQQVAVKTESQTKGEDHCEGKNGIFKTSMGKCNISNLRKNRKNEGWVIDSGATDHMTHEKTELEIMCTSHKTGIINANGKVYPVEGAGEIVLPNQIRLKNTLVVPSLATKLISVSQLTKDQNCVVLMFPDHCVI